MAAVSYDDDRERVGVDVLGRRAVRIGELTARSPSTTIPSPWHG